MGYDDDHSHPSNMYAWEWCLSANIHLQMSRSPSIFSQWRIFLIVLAIIWLANRANVKFIIYTYALAIISLLSKSAERIVQHSSAKWASHKGQRVNQLAADWLHTLYSLHWHCLDEANGSIIKKMESIMRPMLYFEWLPAHSNKTHSRQNLTANSRFFVKRKTTTKQFKKIIVVNRHIQSRSTVLIF